MSHTRVGQAASDPAGPLVDLAPGVADRSWGSPVTMPVVTVRALRYIFSVNLLTTNSSVSGAAAPANRSQKQMPGGNAPR